VSALSRQRLHTALEPVVRREGYDLEDVSVTTAGRRSVVRVVVDRDGGLDLDAVADVSRAISAALDEDQATGNAPYVLEVTSPGVDRPLREPRHWRRNVGRLVEVTIADVGRRTGRITTADDTTVTLDIEGSPSTVSYGDLGPGRVQVEFARDEEDRT
jgi:ribosome maturation factor RimP